MFVVVMAPLSSLGAPGFCPDKGLNGRDLVILGLSKGQLAPLQRRSPAR
jgi:hypothetical protein